MTHLLPTTSIPTTAVMATTVALIPEVIAGGGDGGEGIRLAKAREKCRYRNIFSQRDSSF